MRDVAQCVGTTSNLETDTLWTMPTIHPNPMPSAPGDGRGEASVDFIREAIREDLRQGRFDHVHTRFPPEPNAYLHIGHAKAIWIDYGIAREFQRSF